MNLENLNLVELEDQEVMEIEGGWIEWAIGAALIFAYDAIQSMYKGFKEEWDKDQKNN